MCFSFGYRAAGSQLCPAEPCCARVGCVSTGCSLLPGAMSSSGSTDTPRVPGMGTAGTMCCHCCSGRSALTQGPDTTLSSSRHWGLTALGFWSSNKNVLAGEHLYKLVVIAKQKRHARFSSTQNKTQQVCQVGRKEKAGGNTNKQTNKQSLLWCLSLDPGFSRHVHFLGTQMFLWSRSVLLHVCMARLPHST